MEISVGDTVQHKYRDPKLTGTVVELTTGCNTVVLVDFGKEFLSTVPIQDILKVRP